MADRQTESQAVSPLDSYTGMSDIQNTGDVEYSQDTIKFESP